ncbi:transposase [Streptomyces altiplanensis]
MWEYVTPLLPARPPRRRGYPGRLPVDDRAALRSIVYVLCKSVSRRAVPAEQVGCSGVSAWRRFRDCGPFCL